MNRALSRCFGCLGLLAALCYTAQDTHFAPQKQLIPAPACLNVNPANIRLSSATCTADDYRIWNEDVNHWRQERRIRIGYDAGRYIKPELQWTQSSFIQPQMMVHDRFFFHPVSGRYTVDRYLNDLKSRYGGIDSVLIWPTYPNMGIDDRNQQDMIRSMPGSLPGVKHMVEDFHKRGVRVLFPMMMWDQGTRDPGVPWPQAIAELMREIDADGINGDTQDGVPLAFSEAAEKLGHALAFEPENSPSDEALAWNVLTWGQYAGQFGFVPGVDRFRWLETRHMVHISDRWNRSKTDNLQFAFFNGEGWESWENVWGIWNGISQRDAEATRRVSTLERGIAPFLTSQKWEPFFPTRQYGVFASRWPLMGQTAWTMVNRNEYDVGGEQFTPDPVAGIRYFDLYHGVELKQAKDGALSFPIEAHGFGAVLATREPPSQSLQDVLTRMKLITNRPLATYSHENKILLQYLTEIAATEPVSSTPQGMVPIPGGEYNFQVRGIEIEGSDDTGVDVQYPWEPTPRRFHSRVITLKPFYIDKYPVTNADFKKFLQGTHYRPLDNFNFLKDWKNGDIPPGWANKPVTWVSLEDARAYARWDGKRLPHEWEWQFAAQGTDGREYPWGNGWQADAVPAPDQGRRLRAPDDVGLHPAGASPFGLMDMVGNVWQWTDEYVDDHTRAAILRGGSYYQPQGSMWYFPQAYRNDQHGKLLLMAPSYDRSGTLGFRCVKDSE